jgi:hypothetical protein
MGSLHFIVLALVGLPCLAATGNMLALPIKLDYCGRFNGLARLRLPQYSLLSPHAEDQ